MRRREISIISCIVVICGGLVIQLCRSGESGEGLLTGMLVGIFLLFLSYISRESIGYGDGLVVLTAGVLLGGVETVKLLCYGLFLCSIFSGILFLLRRAGRKSRIPFVAFLLPSFAIMILAEVLWGN